MSIVYCTTAVHDALVHCHYWDQQMNDCTRYAHTARHMLTPALLFPEKWGILMEGWIKLFTITGESPVVILVGVSESSHPSHRGGASVDGETHTIMHPIPCLSLGVPRLGRGNVLRHHHRYGWITGADGSGAVSLRDYHALPCADQIDFSRSWVHANTSYAYLKMGVLEAGLIFPHMLCPI